MKFSKSSLKCVKTISKVEQYIKCVGHVLIEKVYFLFENQVLKGLLKDTSIQKGFLFIFIVLKENKVNYFYNDKKP